MSSMAELSFIGFLGQAIRHKVTFYRSTYSTSNADTTERTAPIKGDQRCLRSDSELRL